ncbi:MAG: IS1380 family transposase [Actinomycetota bacterium]|nr:IS1380 family transposase [Actinomycetota bacterium]
MSLGYRPGRKLVTLVQTIAAGGDCIDDVNLLRAGSTSTIIGHDTVAASTVGTWLRQFTFGHVRQLDRVTEAALTRAWAAGAGPGDRPMFIDVDSTVVEVHGHDKQGAAYGYTRVLGYHPILATRADTGEVLHARMRKGSANTARGAQRFVRETIARVRRAGGRGKLTLRADSGFWSHAVMDACVAHDVDFSITVRAQKHVVAAIDTIDDHAWVDIDYTNRGVAQVAETELGGYRLIVRRTKVTDDPKMLALFPDWRHHAFITNREGDAVDLDRDHRAHAVQELAIRDLKEGAGLNHCPSGIFNANAAWLIAATLAHNLLRWVDLLGVRADRPWVTKTLRRRLLNIPGRLTRSARTWTLHLPTRWPWWHLFDDALERLRVLPAIA